MYHGVICVPLHIHNSVDVHIYLPTPGSRQPFERRHAYAPSMRGTRRTVVFGSLPYVNWPWPSWLGAIFLQVHSPAI